MLTPEYLDLIEFNNVVELYNKLNIEITADIINRVSQMQDITETSKEQLRILVETNGNEIFNQALEQTAMLTADTKKELKNLFEEMAKEDMQGYKELYQYRNKPFKLSATQYKILNQGLKQTNRALKNFTNTIAFESKQAYVQAVDEAYMMVSSGAFDYATAISETAQKLANKGITLKDKKGRNVQLEVAIRRNIRWGIQETANNINRDIEDYLGCNGYEVTAHIGARPTHAEEQGKQFAVKKEDSKKYGVGLWSDVEGLWKEYNCRHSYFGIILGISEPIYSNKQLKEYKNATVTVDGKEIPYYEATQKQRALENNIRKTKRSIQTLEKAGQDATTQKIQLSQLNKQLNNLCIETGLQKDYSRTRIANYSSTKPVKSDIIKISGGVSGALNPNSKEAYKHAQLFYDEISKRKTDYKQIAKNTGYKEKNIKKIKDYIFEEKHIINNEKRKFDADYYMAESWKRLIEGKNIQPHDIILLKHEVAERYLINYKGYSQEDAHIKVSKKYNYGKGVEEYEQNIKNKKKQ